MRICIYILIMALTTYLIRMLPITVFRGEIKSKYLKAFLKYIPVACLTAMTIPAIFTSTEYLLSGIEAFLVAVILALCKRSLVVVAAGSCLAVLITEWVILLV